MQLIRTVTFVLGFLFLASVAFLCLLRDFRAELKCHYARGGLRQITKGLLKQEPEAIRRLRSRWQVDTT